MEVAILNRILNFVLARGWTDYDNFSSKLAFRIARARPRSTSELIDTVKAFSSPFFKLNDVDREKFAENFPTQEILAALDKYAEIGPITFLDIFTEANNVSIDEGKKLVSKLEDIFERVIQNTIRDSLREKNATNPYERKHDSALEPGADHEHFSLEVKGILRTFAGIVKGYKSVKGKTVIWEDVAHQITKAYNRTNPDHILLVLAKNPADSVASELIQYGKSVGNPDLVVICDPVNLVRFLKARGVI